MAYIKFIIFALGDQKYGMRLAKVNGLEPLQNIVPIPVGQQYIKGIIHLRGDVVPIYNLKEHFMIADTGYIDTSQMMITESHGLKMGFEVDNVLGIVAIPEEEIQLLPPVVKNDDTEFIEDVIKVTLPEWKKEELMLSIDVDKLMTDDEFQDVKDALADEEDSGEDA